MAIKKKAILTDNIPQSLTTPVLLNNISIPFALGYPANVTFPNVTQPAGFVRPTQSKGFDITVTDLTKPNPVYLNDLNGIFNLYSGALNDLCSGIPIQFDPSYITNRQSYNNQTPAPTPIPVGYPLDAILFSYPNNAWYRSLSANNIDPSLNSTTIPVDTTKWQKITSYSPILFQQGRLTGSGSPYGDTIPLGNQTLYFRPTYDGNLISLYNGTSWITQSLPATDLQLSVSGLNGNYDVYVANTPTGLILITNAWNNATPPVPTGRTQQNGKWVNSGILGTTPQLQALLVGSINVVVVPNVANSGVVQSWYGNRSIWNLYNQEPQGLLASQLAVNDSSDVGNTKQWEWNFTTWHNQNGNNTDGAGRFSFLTDPLNNKQLTCAYSGGIYMASAPDGGTTGIVLNVDVTTPVATLTTLVNFSAGNVAPPAFLTNPTGFQSWNGSYSYQFNNANTQSLPTGLNRIQKVETAGQAQGRFSDNAGLTATYYG